MSQKDDGFLSIFQDEIVKSEKLQFKLQPMNRINLFPILFYVLLLLFSFSCTEHNNQNAESSETEGSPESVFDQELADELGADNYGMRKYVIAFLKAGPNRDLNSTEAAELQRAHMENIRRMAEEGFLIVAGPFLDDGKIRGIYIFDVETVEEAQELTETDPAIQAGRLEMELHPWYGSAALMKVNEIHEQISTQNP